MKWLWAAVAVTGCGSQQMMEPDAGVNSPPRIVTRTPSTVVVPFFVGTCERPDLSVLVSDDDTNDTLRSLWFVDESDQSHGFSGLAVWGGAKLRELRQPTSGPFMRALENLNLGTHVLTMYVTDRDFEELTTLPPRATQDGFVDQAVWVLDVRPCL